MFGLDDILGGVSGVMGVVNAFGAARKQQEAIDARNKMINSIGSNLQQQYQQLQQGNLQALRRNTGLLGDSLQSQGSDMGSALARAGVSNSSATAGALTKDAAQNATALQGEAQQNFNSEQTLLGQQQDKLNNINLGLNNWGNPNGEGAYGDLAQANQNAAGAASGLSNLAGSLGSLFGQGKATTAAGLGAPATAPQGGDNGFGTYGPPQTPPGGSAALGQDGAISMMVPPGVGGGLMGTGNGIGGFADPSMTRAVMAGTTGGGLGTTTNPLGMNSNFLGAQSGGAIAGTTPPNPTQSMAQGRAIQAGAGIGSPGVNLMSPRNNGPMMNGNQGTAIQQPVSGLNGNRRRMF